MMKCFPDVYQDENAQATVEYILMMAIAVTFVLTFARRFIKPFYEKLENAISSRWEGLFQSGNMHRFKI
jgi:hypothetical protein